MAPHLRTLLSAAVVAGLVTFGQISDASASTFYNWSGTCAIGCSGVSTATLELDDSYQGGSALKNKDFIAFSYSSSSGSFEVPGDAKLRTISGYLPSEGSTDDGNLNLSFRGLNFQITRENGLWASVFNAGGIYEGGYGSTWSSNGGGTVDLPAPASLLTLLGALLALGVVWSRRRPASDRPESLAAA
ncbi:MAG: hypothetical protein R3F54_29130 [Alphaproteobacteria bacterium]